MGLPLTTATVSSMVVAARADAQQGGGQRAATLGDVLVARLAVGDGGLVRGAPRDLAVAQLQEVVSRYDVEGIWIDILYLPGHTPELERETCFCDHCHRQYSEWYRGEHLLDAAGTLLRPEELHGLLSAVDARRIDEITRALRAAALVGGRDAREFAGWMAVGHPDERVRRTALEAYLQLTESMAPDDVVQLGLADTR